MITEDKVRQVLDKPELIDGIQKYCSIMKQVRSVDVTKDAGFQNMFRNFYQLRRFYDDAFAQEYFAAMEDFKNDEDLSFEKVFGRIQKIKGSCEVSFSSKLQNALKPSEPIWDSIVATKHFGFKLPGYGRKDRPAACVKKYGEYKEAFNKYAQSREGKMIVRTFDEKFPGCGISDVKKIDFVLWLDK
jgi:hypothetical protein